MVAVADGVIVGVNVGLGVADAVTITTVEIGVKATVGDGVNVNVAVGSIDCVGEQAAMATTKRSSNHCCLKLF